jgi:hypothetical protein
VATYVTKRLFIKRAKNDGIVKVLRETDENAIVCERTDDAQCSVDFSQISANVWNSSLKRELVEIGFQGVCLSTRELPLDDKVEVFFPKALGLAPDALDELLFVE